MSRFVKLTREHLLLPEGAIVRVVGEEVQNGQRMLIVRQGDGVPHRVVAEHTTEA